MGTAFPSLYVAGRSAPLVTFRALVLDLSVRVDVRPKRGDVWAILRQPLGIALRGMATAMRATAAPLDMVWTDRPLVTLRARVHDLCARRNVGL